MKGEMELRTKISQGEGLSRSHKEAGLPNCGSQHLTWAIHSQAAVSEAHRHRQIRAARVSRSQVFQNLRGETAM